MSSSPWLRRLARRVRLSSPGRRRARLPRLECLEDRLALSLGDLLHTFPSPTATRDDSFPSSLAFSGNFLLAGSAQDDTLAGNAGAAYLYDATTFQRLRTFTKPGAEANDAFGLSVALDGNRVLIGTPRDNAQGTTDSGAVYLFDATNGNLLRTFLNPEPNSNDEFGAAVAIAGDYVVIGSSGDDTAGSLAGAVYVFHATNGNLLHAFLDPAATSNDLFGSSVAVFGDRILVGSPGDNTGANDAGRAYLFDAVSGALVRAFNNPTPNDFDAFGAAVALSGNLVVAGARSDDTAANGAGAAYLFDAATGNLLHTFLNPQPDDNEEFGHAVAVAAGGVLVGARFERTGGTVAGAAFLFSTAGDLLFTFRQPFPSAFDVYGSVVALSSNRVAVGAPLDDTFVRDSGAVYLYEASLSDPLTYDASSNPAVTAYTLRRNGDTLELVETANPGNVLASKPLALTTAVQITGQADITDRLTVDYGFGGFFNVPVSFHGGSGGSDALAVTGGTCASATHTFTAAGAGNIVYDNGVDPALTVSYTGLEAVDMAGSSIADLVFNLPGAADLAVLDDDGTPGNGTSRLRSQSATPTFVTTIFADPTDGLTLNLGDDSGTLTAGGLPDFTRTLTINGQAGADNVSFTGAVHLSAAGADLAVNVGGAIFLGTSVTAAGNVSLVAPVVLTADTTLAGVDVTFASGVNDDGTAGTGSRLTVNASGVTRFNADVGGVSAVERLVTDAPGSTHINAATVNTVATQTYNDAVVLATDTTLTDAAGIVFNGTVNGDGTPRDLTVTVTSAAAAIDFNGDVGGLSPLNVLTVYNPGAAHIAGALQGAGALVKEQGGTLILSSAASGYAGTTDVKGGTLLLTGALTATSAATVHDGALLGGTGTINAAVAVTVNAGGTVAPGTSLGILRSGSVAFGSGSTFAVELNGPAAGTQHDQLAVAGGVDLGSASLNVTLGYTPTSGDRLMILDNDGTEAVVGTFAGLPQGARLFSGANTLSLSYSGGDGNDVVLIANQAPTADAGGPYTVPEGGTVPLSAAGSTNPDQDSGTLTYQWDLDGDNVFGETGAAAARGNEVGSSPTFNAAVLDGTTDFTVSLRVTDSVGLTSSDTATVTVANVDPTGNPGGPYTVNAEGTVQLRGSATDPAGPRDPLTFTWDLDADDVFGETGTDAFRGDETGPTPTFSAHGLTGPSSFTVRLRVGDGDGGSDTDAVAVTIRPVLTVGDVSVVEGNAGTSHAVFIVSLTGGGQPVTVQYATANGTATAGSDYTVISDTLTFAPATSTQTVSVAVQGDALREGHETFFLNLSGATNAFITDGQGIGTVLNDDADLRIADAAAVEGTGGPASLVLPVTLNFASALRVTIAYSTADNTAKAPDDYAAASGTLTFAPGETRRLLTVAVAGDVMDENSETFRVNLSAAVNAFLADGQGLGTILDDDDPPVISISDATVVEGSAGFVDLVFTVTLSAPSGKQVTVNFATVADTATAGSDYLATSGVLIFAAGVTQRTITVRVKADTLAEGDERLFVDLTGVANAVLGTGRGNGTIRDDD